MYRVTHTHTHTHTYIYIYTKILEPKLGTFLTQLQQNPFDYEIV